jgi:hypothetical protein
MFISGELGQSSRCFFPQSRGKVREEFGTRLLFLDWIAERIAIQGEIDVVGEVLQGPHMQDQLRLAGKSSYSGPRL